MTRATELRALTDAELRQEFVDVAILAAERVINESLDKAKHRRLIEEVLEESATLKQG